MGHVSDCQRSDPAQAAARYLDLLIGEISDPIGTGAEAEIAARRRAAPKALSMRLVV